MSQAVGFTTKNLERIANGNHPVLRKDSSPELSLDFSRHEGKDDDDTLF